MAKLSAIFVFVFGLGLIAVAYVFHTSLQTNARADVLNQARMLMGTAAAMRNYTNDHVKIALAQAEHNSAIPPEQQQFHAETVPAFASTELFTSLRSIDKDFTDYFYKEATLNPTNLRDRASEWETDVINEFRNHPDKTQLDGERDTATGRAMYLARPLVARESCLECHSTPDRAPASMVKIYGPVNGFGWQKDEIIGAQIISVPVSKATGMADQAFRQLIVSLLIVGLLDLILYFFVVRELNRFAANADEISRGKLDVPELAVRGRDEIAKLAAAFNRMHRSFNEALKLLDRQ
jgi:methyl-accepting chemotaxis protein